MIRNLFVVLALAVVPAIVVLAPSTASADARSEARAHYQAGVRAYNAGDFRTAIREFSQAQSLAPADLNNYNLALCYDKLGEAEPAIQYYRAYLDKVPSSNKRREIEASIKRLDAGLKSAAAKKAEEERKAEEARKAIEAKKAAEAEEARRLAEEEAAKEAAEEAKRRAEEEAAAKQAEDQPEAQPEERPDAEADAIGDDPARPVGGGTIGTPGTSTVQTTGDAQLDRAAQIDINQIRDARFGGGGSGLADPNRGPGAVAPVAGAGADAEDPRRAAPPTTASASPTATNDTAATTGATPPPEAPADKPKATPVYKKWWFWAVVAVSAYVVYSIATDDSASSNQAREATMFGNGLTPGRPGGATLFRF